MNTALKHLAYILISCKNVEPAIPQNHFGGMSPLECCKNRNTQPNWLNSISADDSYSHTAARDVLEFRLTGNPPDFLRYKIRFRAHYSRCSKVRQVLKDFFRIGPWCTDDLKWL